MLVIAHHTQGANHTAGTELGVGSRQPWRSARRLKPLHDVLDDLLPLEQR